MAVDQKELERRLSAFDDTCRKRGIRATHQRREIFRELARTEEHPDAEMIHKRVRRRIPSISLDTVYRNLRFFEEVGTAARVSTVGDRARFDANDDTHHHFVCTQCGAIQDFYSKELDQFAVQSDAQIMGKVDSVHVELRGVCGSCRAKA